MVEFLRKIVALKFFELTRCLSPNLFLQLFSFILFGVGGPFKLTVSAQSIYKSEATKWPFVERSKIVNYYYYREVYDHIYVDVKSK